jgi:hypothetical protein
VVLLWDMNRVTFTNPAHQAGLMREPVADLEPVLMNEKPCYEKNKLRRKMFVF